MLSFKINPLAYFVKMLLKANHIFLKADENTSKYILHSKNVLVVSDSFVCTSAFQLLFF